MDRTTEDEARLDALRTISLVSAAKLLGIGKNRAYEQAHRNTFPVPVRTISNKMRVRISDIEAFLNGNSQGGDISVENKGEW